jgi:hypothetical protein
MNGVKWESERTNQIAACEGWRIHIERPRGMVLEPLAEVGLRVVVPIWAGRGDLMLKVLNSSQRRHDRKNGNED